LLSVCLKALACNVKRALKYWGGQLREALQGSGPTAGEVAAAI
jgi:hypothetical protein